MAFSVFEPSRSKASLLISLLAVSLVFISFILGVQFGKGSDSSRAINTSDYVTNHDNPLGNQLNEAIQNIPSTSDPVATQPTMTEPPKIMYMVVIGPLEGQNEKDSKSLIKQINREANLIAITTKYKGNNFWVRLVPSYTQSEGNRVIQELKQKGFSASLQSEKR
ncbi:MAG: SPOR domain-containing protein [Holophagaceae bacterium]